MSLPKRRGPLQLIKDGLLGIAEFGYKTSFMQIGRTSYDQQKTYIPLCLKEGLLKKNGRRFFVTEKGWNFIHSIETAEKLIGVERVKEEAS